ncbi:MAG: DUF3857 domain-containing protein, partial [Pseudomonadota bacterium]
MKSTARTIAAGLLFAQPNIAITRLLGPMARRTSLAAAGLLAVSSSLAHADNTQVALTPEPDWVSPSELMAVPEDAQGQFFYRKQDTIIHLTETGSRYYQGQTVRILNSQALQAGNIQLAWNPAAGRPEVHSIKIRRGPRVIDVLENSTFEILRREDQLETAVLDGMLTAVLQVPDLRVGDDLEFAYTVPLHDPTLGATSHGLLLLGQAPPAG